MRRAIALLAVATALWACEGVLGLGEYHLNEGAGGEGAGGEGAGATGGTGTGGGPVGGGGAAPGCGSGSACGGCAVCTEGICVPVVWGGQGDSADCADDTEKVCDDAGHCVPVLQTAVAWGGEIHVQAMGAVDQPGSMAPGALLAGSFTGEITFLTEQLAQTSATDNAFTLRVKDDLTLDGGPPALQQFAGQHVQVVATGPVAGGRLWAAGVVASSNGRIEGQDNVSGVTSSWLSVHSQSGDPMPSGGFLMIDGAAVTAAAALGDGSVVVLAGEVTANSLDFGLACTASWSSGDRFVAVFEGCDAGAIDCQCASAVQLGGAAADIAAVTVIGPSNAPPIALTGMLDGSLQVGQATPLTTSSPQVFVLELKPTLQVGFAASSSSNPPTTTSSLDLVPDGGGAGGVLVTGWFKGGAITLPGGSTLTPGDGDTRNLFLVHLDGGGQTVGQPLQVHNPEKVGAAEPLVDLSLFPGAPPVPAAVIMAGCIAGTVDFGSGVRGVEGKTSLFVARYSLDLGELSYLGVFSVGSALDASGVRAVPDNEGGIILAADFSGTFVFPGLTVSAVGVRDLFLAHFRR